MAARKGWLATKCVGIVKHARIFKLECDRAMLEGRGWTFHKQVNIPSIAQLSKWSDDGCCKALDGCKVEPDGKCSHGFPSWMIQMGII